MECLVGTCTLMSCPGSLLSLLLLPMIAGSMVLQNSADGEVMVTGRTKDPPRSFKDTLDSDLDSFSFQCILLKPKCLQIINDALLLGSFRTVWGWLFDRVKK